MSHWKRPENVPFPSIWRTFERKGSDGITKKSPEYENDFIGMGKLFSQDEILCKASKFAEDPQAVEELKDLWRKSKKQKLALICLTQDKHGKLEFVGGNMTCLSTKGEDFSLEGKTKVYQKVLSAIGYVTEIKNVFDEFNVNEYLTAYGLYVNAKFRGQDIGTEILKARRELCLAVGLKVSATVFTSIISQKNAQKSGFQEFVEIDYDDLEKVNPDWNFPGVPSFTKSIKLMCLKYE